MSISFHVAALPEPFTEGTVFPPVCRLEFGGFWLLVLATHGAAPPRLSFVCSLSHSFTGLSTPIWGGISSRAARLGPQAQGRQDGPCLSHGPPGTRSRGEQVLGARRGRTEGMRTGADAQRAPVPSRLAGASSAPGSLPEAAGGGSATAGGRGALLLSAPGAEAEMEFGPSSS